MVTQGFTTLWLQGKWLKGKSQESFTIGDTRLKNQEGISNTFLQHFKSLFSLQDDLSELNIRRKLNSLCLPRLIKEHLEALGKPLSMAEVKNVIFQIGLFKAFGIDGKLSIFFQKYWNVVGELTTASSLSCLWTLVKRA